MAVITTMMEIIFVTFVKVPAVMVVFIVVTLVKLF